MTKRAARVAQLLRDLKRIVNPNSASSGDEKGAVSAMSNECRVPKCPWEEISKDQPESSHTPTVSSVIRLVVKPKTLTSSSLLILASMIPFLIAYGIVANDTLRSLPPPFGPLFLSGFYRT